MSIELIVLDVDGTMTDSRITYSEEGDEIKSFNVKDGLAIASWRKLGKEVAIITGRSSKIVERRAKELHIEHFYQGIHNKKEVLEELLEKLELTMDNVAAIGDDLNDLKMLKAAKISFVPRDASAYVDKVATVILSKKGGDGAVREMIEQLIVQEGLEKEVFGLMGVRIELVLFVAIVIIVGGSFTMKLNDNADKLKPFTKELEFTNTTFTEVDTVKLQGHAYGTYGVRDDGVLTITNLRYKTDAIKSLIANKGTYMGNTIYLEGDVVMDDTNGYIYETQQAEYNQETEILNITAPFVATRDDNIMKGDTFTYNTRKEEAYGTAIDAVVYTIEK